MAETLYAPCQMRHAYDQPKEDSLRESGVVSREETHEADRSEF